jgi:hypothetical protein
LQLNSNQTNTINNSTVTNPSFNQASHNTIESNNYSYIEDDTVNQYTMDDIDELVTHINTTATSNKLRLISNNSNIPLHMQLTSDAFDYLMLLLQEINNIPGTCIYPPPQHNIPATVQYIDCTSESVPISTFEASECLLFIRARAKQRTLANQFRLHYTLFRCVKCVSVAFKS